MADDDIKVRIAGELADIQRSLQDLRRNTRASGGDAKNASREWGGFGRSLDGVQRRIVGVVGAYLSFRGVQSLFRGVISSTVEFDKVTAQLRATLQSTGEAAGFSFERLTAMSQQLSAATGVSDNEIVQAQTRLLTYTNIVGDEFTAALQLAIDQSVRLGQGIEQSAEIIGQALQDPIKSMQTLGRQGFKLEGEQRALVRSLQETGRMAEAQAVIIEMLQESYGGAAAAARGTLGGAFADLRNAGQELLRADDGLPGVAASVNDLADTLRDPLVREGMQGLINSFATMAATAARATSSVVDFFQFLGEEAASRFGGPAFDDLVRIEQQIDRLRRRLAELGNEWASTDSAGFRAQEARLKAELAQLEALRDFSRGTQGGGASGGAVVSPETAPARIAVDPRIALRRLEGDLQAAGTVLADELRRMREGLDRELEEGLLSYSSFFQRRAALEVQQVDQTLSQRRNALTLLSEEIRLLEDRGEETEQQENRRKQLVAEITVLERQRADVATKATQDQAKAERDLARELEQVAIRLQQLQGDGVGARGAQLEREFEELVKRLEVEGDAAGVALVRRLINVEMAKTELASLEQTYSRAMAEFSREEQRLRIASETGVISELEARRQIIALYERTRGTIDELVPRMQALSDVTGDPADIERVKELVAAFERLGDTLLSAQDLSTQLVQGGLDGLQRGTKDLLMNLENVEGIGDAWRSVARVIVNSLRDILAEMIAVQIRAQAMGFLTAAFGGGGGAAAGSAAAGMATGGLVEGPGTPTSDSILARLSTGEHVTRAKAVSAPGVLPVLEYINRYGKLPQFRAGGLVAAHRALSGGVHIPTILPRFAQGGQVGNVAGAAAGQGSAVRIVNVLDPAFVPEGIGTPQGERAIVNVIERNAAGIQRLLGR